MSRDEALSELAHLRTLAEEGRSAPLLSGGPMIGWGVLVSAAFLGHGLVVNSVPPSGDWGLLLGGVWGVFGVLAGLMTAFLKRRLADRPGAGAVSNRADRAIWSGASLIMVVFALGMLGHMAISGDFTAPNAIPAAAFAVYGGAMLASSLIAGEPALRPFAFLAAFVGLVLAVAADQPWMYYAASAGALATLALPGALLLKREPRA